LSVWGITENFNKDRGAMIRCMNHMKHGFFLGGKGRRREVKTVIPVVRPLKSSREELTVLED
jgi:hypothetical protein